MLKKCKYCNKNYSSYVSTRKFCSVPCSNKYNRNRFIDVPLPKKTVELAELVGIILGDGCLTKYQISISLNRVADKAYILYVENLLLSLFPGAPISKIDRGIKFGCVDVRINSIKVVEFFRDMGIESFKPMVPSWIYTDLNYIAACIRGLVDTEGSIGFKTYTSKQNIRVYKQITFTGLNPVLLEFVRDGLLKLGFKPTQHLVKNIYISNSEHISLYNTIIGFHNPKLQEKCNIMSYNDLVSYL